MKPTITDWLRKETLPRNLYELLGRSLFDPNREELLLGLRSANRELLDYQSHPEPAIAKRAMALLTELGRVRGILEDPTKLRIHNDELIQSLRQEFAKDRGAAGAEFPTWLAQHYDLNPIEAERVAVLVDGIEVVLPPALLPKPVRAKFGAFAAIPPKPITVGEVFSLDDFEVPGRALKPIPERKSERVPQPSRPLPIPPPFPPRKKQPSLVRPIFIGGSVLLLSVAISVVYVATRSSPVEKVAANDAAPQVVDPSLEVLSPANPKNTSLPIERPPKFCPKRLRICGPWSLSKIVITSSH